MDKNAENKVIAEFFDELQSLICCMASNFYIIEEKFSCEFGQYYYFPSFNTTLPYIHSSFCS